MKISYHSLNTYMAVMAMFISSFCFAQSKVIVVSDSTGLHSYYSLKGDTLLIAYDSAFILNKITNKLYRENYTRALNRNALDSLYESLVNLQDSMHKTKDAYYQQLKNNFDSVSSQSITFANRTDANVQAINASLTTATRQLNDIQTLLNASLEKLEKQRQQNIRIAIGGFAIGVVITGLVFLVAN